MSGISNGDARQGDDDVVLQLSELPNKEIRILSGCMRLRLQRLPNVVRNVISEVQIREMRRTLGFGEDFAPVWGVELASAYDGYLLHM
jgi:hypothetical protein